MNSNQSRYIAGGLLAVGVSIGAALAVTPGVASADPSTDPYSLIDQLLGGLSVPAQTTSALASLLDMQVSIDGTDLFPTAGNTATAFTPAGEGDIAIAIGNGANASADAGGGVYFGSDFAFADGTNSTADAGENGGDDSAVVFGANSTADAGFNGNSDYAWVFGADSTADAGFGEQPTQLFPLGFPNNSDLAAIFGDMLHATATSGSNMVDILPSL
jgi:hypothetical protein